MNIIPFTPEHALTIKLQPMQAGSLAAIDPSYAENLARVGQAYSVVEGELVVFCGGIAPIWSGRSMLWALVSDQACKHMLFITRGVKRFIELHQGGRIETIVRSDFKQAHRWAKMLGLNWHHHEERYLPGGLDADIYVRFC